MTNDILINLQEKDGFDDNHEHDMISDHMMQLVLINVPLMPRIKMAKEAKKIREVIDIKITKDKYVEGEEIKYTGIALKWQEKIRKMYEKGKEKIIRCGESPSENLRRISSWMYENTYKKFTVGHKHWSIETAVLDTYERTLYKLQRLLVVKATRSVSKIKKMIEKMVTPWEIRINREGGNDDEKKIYLSSLTGVTPQQWREIKGGQEALNLIIEQLKINHKINQGKKRKERLEEAKKWRKKMRKKHMRVGQEELIST